MFNCSNFTANGKRLKQTVNSEDKNSLEPFSKELNSEDKNSLEPFSKELKVVHQNCSN